MQLRMQQQCPFPHKAKKILVGSEMGAPSGKKADEQEIQPY